MRPNTPAMGAERTAADLQATASAADPSAVKASPGPNRRLLASDSGGLAG